MLRRALEGLLSGIRGPSAKAALVIVGGLLVCALVASHISWSTPISGLPAGHWRGTAHFVRIADLTWATLTITTNSDFWFVADASGIITGQATCSYEMALDDSRLRSLASWGNAHANSLTAGLIPGIGQFLGPGFSTKDIIGVSASIDEGRPLRTGKITGKLTGSSIHLNWADQPQAVQYKYFVEYPTRKQIKSQNEMKAFAPWRADATITQVAPGQFEAAVDPSRMQQSEGNTKNSSFWTAYRVTATQ